MSGVVHATAWYTLPGGNGPGSPVLRARTFDVDLNNFRKETPIASATPAGAWPGPNNHSVSTATENAAATAKNALLYPEPFPSQPPGTLAKYFQSWLAVAGPITADAAPGHVVHCSAKHSIHPVTTARTISPTVSPTVVMAHRGCRTGSVSMAFNASVSDRPR